MHTPDQPHGARHHHARHDGHRHNGFDVGAINTSFMIAVAANLIITLIEAVYGFLANAMSLLADAGHNLSDVLGLLLAWGAAYLASKKVSETYSYGFRRTTILAALINSLTLLFASGYIAYASVEKLFTPAEMATVPVMLVATIGILVNAGSAMLFMRGSKEDLNLKGAYLHLAYDAGISAGVVVAAILIYFTHWYWVDPVVGLLIVAAILLGTWSLLRDSVNLILDAVPEGVDGAAVRAYLSAVEGVKEVHDMHIWAMSTNENCLTAHLVMPENTLWDSPESYSAIGNRLRLEFNVHHVTLQVEKDPDCTNKDCD